MASGVKVCEKIKELYDTMKVNKSTDDAMERIRVLVLGLTDDYSLIELKHIVMEKDLEKVGNVFKYIQELMKEGECVYIVYDCHYETELTKKEDLVFIMWSCDNAATKKRMLYSSSKRDLMKKLDVKFGFELHGKDETTIQAFVKKLAKENIIKLEGLDVKEA